MIVCAYAGCGSAATHTDDGWDLCRPHYREHRADIHGEAWPEMKPVSGQIDQILRWGCGTTARLRRHYRDGEECRVCIDAAFIYRNPNGVDTRQPARRRSA